MVICSQNEGKLLYGKYARDRQRALEDRTRFDSDELTWLDIGTYDGTGRTNDITYEVPIDPTDPRSHPTTKKYDIRTKPTVGD